jgi:hypothetical protein
LGENSLLDFGDIPECDLDENLASAGPNNPPSNSATTEDKDAELRTLKNENRKLLDMAKELEILLNMYR